MLGLVCCAGGCAGTGLPGVPREGHGPRALPACAPGGAGIPSSTPARFLGFVVAIFLWVLITEALGYRQEAEAEAGWGGGRRSLPPLLMSWLRP